MEEWKLQPSRKPGDRGQKGDRLEYRIRTPTRFSALTQVGQLTTLELEVDSLRILSRVVFQNDFLNT